MRTVLRSLIAAAALVLVVVPSAASASAPIPVHRIGARGGSFLWNPTVHKAKTCTWWSSPKVTGFDATVKCTNGRVARTARFAANTSTKAKQYLLTLTVRGKVPAVWHLQIIEAGKTVTVNCRTRLTVGKCEVTFATPDDAGAKTIAVLQVMQNIASPDPNVSPTPASDQLYEVEVAITAGSDGMATPGSEVDLFGLALGDGGQGTLDDVTFDGTVPYAMGALKAEAPGATFIGDVYFDVTIGSGGWSSVNYQYDFSQVYAFYP